MLHILIQHAYDTYNDYVLALKGNREIEWQSPEAYKSFPWGGGGHLEHLLYMCVYVHSTNRCMIFWIMFFF